MHQRYSTAFLFGLIFSVFPLSVYAGIYKCQDNRGKVVFRDEPCAAGSGERFSLGATIEEADPTGTFGDISGFYRANDASVEIKDALGVLDKSKAEIVLYLVPVRYTSADVKHFKETGDESLLQQKPSLDPAGLKPFPYLKLRIRFKEGAPLTRENILSAETSLNGLQANAKPLVLEQTPEAARANMRYMSVFEDITQGDINLEAEHEAGIDNQQVSWKLSIRAPLYFR